MSEQRAAERSRAATPAPAADLRGESRTILGLLERAGQSGVAAGVRLLDRREREEWVPWRELLEGSRRLAAGLLEGGLEPKERVGLVFPTGRAFLEAFFGVLAAGGVPAPLYPPVRLPRLDEYQERTARMLRSIDAALVLADARVRRILGPAILAARPRLGCLLPDELPTPAELSPFPSPAPDALALVQFSSGTTVDPKPVALDHRALLAQVEILNAFWPDDETVLHSGVSWLPLYHDMGLIGCILPAVERPATITLIPPEAFVARPSLWLRAISRYRATISPAPNFAYGLCVEKIRDVEVEGCDLGSWRIALCGAEAVAPRVLRAFAERFSACGLRAEALTPVYGLSEAALAVTFSDLARPFRSARFDRAALGAEGRARRSDGGVELASVGRPVPGFQIEVRDEAGGVQPAGGVGRIWVRGPSLMRGYLGHPEATRKVLRDGWLDTGDLGFLDEGELFLFGRAKDVLILRGQNHAPEPLEQAVSALDEVRSGCVVAASDRGEGDASERLLLFVERRRDARCESDALAKQVRGLVLERFGLEAQAVVLEPGTLPRTTSGKLRRRETLELHRAGRLAPPAIMGPVRLLRALVRSRAALRRAAGEGR